MRLLLQKYSCAQIYCSHQKLRMKEPTLRSVTILHCKEEFRWEGFSNANHIWKDVPESTIKNLISMCIRPELSCKSRHQHELAVTFHSYLQRHTPWDCNSNIAVCGPALVGLAGMPYLCHHHWAGCNENLPLKSAAVRAQDNSEVPCWREPNLTPKEKK